MATENGEWNGSIQVEKRGGREEDLGKKSSQELKYSFGFR